MVMGKLTCRAGIETQACGHSTEGKERVGQTDWETGTDIYTLQCVRQTDSGELPYSTGSSALPL